MATITLKGNTCKTVGELPKVGSSAPDFTLTKTDLAEISLKECAGKQIILNIFPSIDTPTCASSVRNFNKTAVSMQIRLYSVYQLIYLSPKKDFAAAKT